MLDQQRLVQSKAVKSERFREIDGAQRKQRIKQIYGQQQELTNKLQYFQELRPLPVKSSSLNPSNSRRRLRSDQCIYTQEQLQNTPNNLIKQNNKKRSYQTEYDDDQNNIIYNNKITEQNRNKVQPFNNQYRQQNLSLQPIIQKESMDSEAQYKSTFDQSKYNKNYIPSYIRTPITLQDHDDILYDYLTNTQLMYKKEYNKNQNNLSPNRMRDESSLGKKNQKKKSKSKLDQLKYFTPDIHDIPYQFVDTTINKQNSYIYDDLLDPSSYLIDQYTASKSNIRKNNQSTKNLENINYQNIQKTKDDASLSPKEVMKIKSKNTIDNQFQNLLNNKENSTQNQNQNEQNEKEEILQGRVCSLPNVNQNSKMAEIKDDPEMLEFQANVDRTLAQQSQYQYMYGLHHNLNTTKKAKGIQKTRYNMNNSMIGHSQNPDLLINNDYKQLLNKSFIDVNYQKQNKSPIRNLKTDPNENELRQSQYAKINQRILSLKENQIHDNQIKRSNSTDTQQNLMERNQQNYINLNSNDKINGIMYQKYGNEVPYSVLQPIRNSYANYKLKTEMNDQSHINDEFEMQQQARDYQSTLLQDQLQYQKQYKKQMYNKYKVSPPMRNSPNFTPQIIRSPHLPKVNCSKYQQNHSRFINNSHHSSKYQYFVENQPRFEIKVVPRLTYNQRCQSTQPNIIYLSPSQQQNREQNYPFVLNDLQYLQNIKSHKQMNQPINDNKQFIDKHYQINNNPNMISEGHQQYIQNQYNTDDKSSNLQNSDDNVVIEQEYSPVKNIQKIEESKQNSKQTNLQERNDSNQQKTDNLDKNINNIIGQNLQNKNIVKKVKKPESIRKVSSQIYNQNITIEDSSNESPAKKKESQKQEQEENSSQEDRQLNDNQKQNKQISLMKEKKLPQINDLYYYQLNVNYTQREVEDIYNKFVQLNQRKRRQCCLEPFFTKAEHVVWIDNFQIKIDSSFQNQMLFKMRVGNEDEAKIYLKYEDTEITNQWIFTKLKDTIKCLPLKISEGVVLAGKNNKTSLKCFFSLVYLQSLDIDTADLDYQYVNYSEEFMKIIKSLCIGNFFTSILSQQEQSPSIQTNNFPVYFPSYNALAYENEIYLDLEEMNSLSKQQNIQYSDQQVLRLIQDTLVNIKKFHERNISINNININNIVYSKDTNTFKILSYVYCELNEDCLTPRQETEVEQKYNQNPIYFSLKKFNLYKRDIYALGICAIIFKFQLTDNSLNQETIQEKINSMKSIANPSPLNKIILELVEQQQVVRSSELAQTYIEQFFSKEQNPKSQVNSNSHDKESQNKQTSQPHNINKSMGLVQNSKQNAFENLNLFEVIEQKPQNGSPNTQIQELQGLKKCFEHCGKINQFFSSYQNIVETQKQIYGLSSAIYLESLIEFYFEALHHNQREKIQTVIDFIEKENLFTFISQIPKNQLANRFMLASAFKFLLDNNIDKSMKYFDRVLAFPKLTIQDQFQLNLNLGILANQKQKKQKAITYLKQAQAIVKQVQKPSLNHAAPYLLSGIINEDENELQTALQIKKENNEDPGKVLNLLFKIGSLCLKKKDFTKGEEIFRAYMQSRDELSEDVSRKSQFFQAKLNLAFCMLGKKPDHPILSTLVNEYLVELRQIYGQQSKESLYALYEISEVLFNLKVDLDEIIPIYIQCKQIATLINENELIIELENKIDKLENQQQLERHKKEL